MLEVVEPGPLLTIQDAGRPGLAHLGVPLSGACDPWGLAVANLLAEAPRDAPALEVTLGGCVLRAVEACAVALAGADLGAQRDDGRPLRGEAVHRVPAGALVRVGGGGRGARAYVALAGGIDVAPVMGSASSYLPGQLGFADGRPLRPGDRLEPRRRGDLGAAGRTWPSRMAPHPAAGIGPLGIVPGPDGAAAPPSALERFVDTSWLVSPAADRMGIRLAGPSLGAGGEIVSHPLLPGAVQLPPGGRPIVSLVDGPTIGGYPVIGVVPAADLPRLGQLRPGDDVRFAIIEPELARALWRRQRVLLDGASATLEADDAWRRLADGAGG